MKTLVIDDKWSIRYDEDNNDLPVSWLRNGESHSYAVMGNPQLAMFYALLKERKVVNEASTIIDDTLNAYDKKDIIVLESNEQLYDQSYDDIRDAAIIAKKTRDGLYRLIKNRPTGELKTLTIWELADLCVKNNISWTQR